MKSVAQKNIFTEVFYDLWIEEGFGDTDLSSPYPWGCPWMDDRNFVIESDPEEHAGKYFDLVKDEIKGYKEEATYA